MQSSVLLPLNFKGMYGVVVAISFFTGFLIRCNCLRSELAFRNINNKTIRQRCMTLRETPTLQSDRYLSDHANSGLFLIL